MRQIVNLNNAVWDIEEENLERQPYVKCPNCKEFQFTESFHTKRTKLNAPIFSRKWFGKIAVRRISNGWTCKNCKYHKDDGKTKSWTEEL